MTNPNFCVQQPPASAKDSPYMAWTGVNEGKRDEEKFGGKNTGPRKPIHRPDNADHKLENRAASGGKKY